MSEEDLSFYEVTLKFKLPQAQRELDDSMNGSKYSSALWDIYDLCRNVWKYEENVSEDRVKFAEEIGEMISETGVMER